MATRPITFGVFGAATREADTRNRQSPGDVSPHDLGIEGEHIAAQYLERRGYDILERNWYCPGGEADIIAFDDGTHVLVEVKSRLQVPGDAEVVPEDAVGTAKRRRYRQIAQYYVAATGAESVRFDVIAVSFDGRGAYRVRHLVNAFGGDD